MIDREGYRSNVGIILSNHRGRLFWARRIGQDAWQFPQGGIQEGEKPEESMFRELHEEIGLQAQHVEIIGTTKDWLSYRLPDRYVRHHCEPLCIGQKQIWYLLRLVGSDHDVQLDCGHKPEFDRWRWVNYWYPLKEVVPFKRKVYSCALNEFASLLPKNIAPHAAKHSHCRRAPWIRVR